MRVLLGLVVLGWAGLDAAPLGCEASPSAREVLDILAAPPNVRHPAAARKARVVNGLRQALAREPQDIFLHEAYQDATIGPIGDERGQVMGEYEALLAKHPDDPAFLYLAARANYGWDTKRAVRQLEEAIARAPGFAPAHLLLARIYSASAFHDPGKVAAHLDRFSELCPSSVRVFPELAWSKDRELIARTVARLRKALSGRFDTEAAAAYPYLWRLEAALERSDNQAANRERLRKDAETLRDRRFARNTEWFAAIRFAAGELARPEWLAEARRELAADYPNSAAARELEWSERKERDSTEVNLAIARRWPGSLGMADSMFRTAVVDRSTTLHQVGEALDLLRLALRNEPEALLTSPPVPIDAARYLVERGMLLEDIPELVRMGFVLTERTYQANSRSDLFANAVQEAQRYRNYWYLFGYFPLIEANIRLSRMEEASETLRAAEDVLNRMRPSETPASEERSRHEELEAWLWYLKGLYASRQGRKLDALVAYRNSIATYPPRRPRPDRREEVMQAAEQLWKEMGGTAQGWSDWAAHSPLTRFYAGSGGPNAWAQLAAAKPGLLLTDSQGNQWRSENLAEKTSFVTLWASWCGPCRAEMPYLEKLVARFRDRPDIAILALNVDDEPAAMDTALKELKVAVPSIAARDFAYDMLPTMAIPASWLITPAKSQMFRASRDNLDKWFQDVVQAVEKAAGK